MKKLLGIVFLGLLWSNISFSEIIKFNCKDLLASNTNLDQGIAKITYVIDTSNNVFTVEVEASADEKKKFKELYEDGVITKDVFEKASGIATLNTEVLKVNGKTITYRYLHNLESPYVNEFNYEKNYFIDYQIKPNKRPYISCGTKPDEPDEEVYKSLIEKPKKKKIAKKESTNESVETNTLKLKSLNACMKCNLQGADLSRANLREANLKKANLSGANLRGANLNGAIFCNTIMPWGIENSGC